LFKKTLINNQIRAFRVRVVDETGKQLGVLNLREALQIAQERNLDLIQVTEKVEPPVCKIMDYGKYQYQLQKKEKAAKAKQVGETKGIRLGFNISLHDMKVKAEQTEKFLKKGDKVIIELRLRGREKAFQELAKEKMNQFLKMLEELLLIKIERGLKKESRGFTIIIAKG